MDKYAEEKLLKIAVQLRMKFEEDLSWIIKFSQDHPEIGLGTILNEVNNLHIHFVKLEAIVTQTINAAKISSKQENSEEVS